LDAPVLGCWRALALTAALAAALAGCGSTSEKKPTPPAARSHVVVIVMENLAYSDVIGEPKMPYVNTLASRAAVPAEMYGVAHPSLTNYLALLGGDTFAVTTDCTTCHFGSPSLPDQLEAAGLTWKGYMQSMPRPCFKGTYYGRYPKRYRLLDPAYRFLPGYRERYAKKHDPFMYFDRIAGDSRRCANVVPLPQLTADIRGGHLPDFSLIAPDRCFDTHDCVIEAGDSFLKRLVPQVLPHLGPHGFLMITWDEGRTNRGCCGGLARGGRIATLVLGPDVMAGSTGAGKYTHYSTLRTVEDAFGLPHLKRAGNPAIQPLDALFKSPPRLSPAP
jgi:hypothetical protein